jgi:hypothetical protein
LLEVFVIPSQTASIQNELQQSESEIDTDAIVNKRRNGIALTAAVSIKPTFYARDTNKYYSGRVGFGCVFCRNQSDKEMYKWAFYPRGLSSLYKGVCEWQRLRIVH